MGGGFLSNSEFLDNVYLNTLELDGVGVHAWADNYADGFGDVDATAQAAVRERRGAGRLRDARSSARARSRTGPSKASS